MIGSKLGPYELLEEVGRGGMAAVYRAFQPNVDRFVAVKVIYRSIAADDKALERFQREARLIARLEHPHILPVYDYNGLNDPPYIVMRYLPTGTLKDVLERDQLPFSEVSYLLTQVASALDYAHRQGVVHRDIKPSNIMIDPEGSAYLTDFGIARMVEASQTQGLTGTGMAIGTPGYMAPEQGLGTPIDSRADIYSLGVMLYEMLSGQMPYSAPTPMAVIMRHISDPLPVITNVNPNVPPGVNEIIQKAMAKKPEDRYSTASEFGRAFANAVGPSENVAPLRLQAIAARTNTELAAVRAEKIRANPTPLMGVTESTTPVVPVVSPGGPLPTPPLVPTNRPPTGTQTAINPAAARGAAVGAGIVILLVALIAVGAFVITSVSNGNVKATSDSFTQVAVAIAATTQGNASATQSAGVPLTQTATIQTAAAQQAAGSATAQRALLIAALPTTEQVHPSATLTLTSVPTTSVPPTTVPTTTVPVVTVRPTVTLLLPTNTVHPGVTPSILPTSIPLTVTPIIVTLTSVPTHTPQPSATYTLQPTFTARPTDTPLPTHTLAPTATTRPSATFTPIPPSATATFSPLPPTAVPATKTPTVVPTIAPTVTVATITPSNTTAPTPTATLAPTLTLVANTDVPPTNVPVVVVPATAAPILTPTPVPAGQLPYVNDMEAPDALTNWDLDPSAWRILPDSGNSALVGNSGLNKPAVVLGKASPPPAWADPNNRNLYMSLNIQLDNQLSVGRVIFRYSDSGYYVMELGSGLIKLSRGASNKIDRPTEKQLQGGIYPNAPIRSGTFYQWNIWSDDNRVYVYQDNHLVLQAKDAGTPLPGGSILFQTLSPQLAYSVRYDNLKVQRPVPASQHFEGSGWPSTWTRTDQTTAIIGDDNQGNHFIEQSSGNVSPRTGSLTDFLIACRLQSLQGGFDIHLRESGQGYYLMHFAEGNMTLSTIDNQGKPTLIQTFPNFYARSALQDFSFEFVGDRITIYTTKDIWTKVIANGPSSGEINFLVTRKDNSVRIDDVLITETAKSSTELAQWAFDKIAAVEARPDRELYTEFYDYFVDKLAKKDWWEGAYNAPGEPKTDPKSRDFNTYLQMIYKDGASYRIFRYVPSFLLFGVGNDKQTFRDSSDVYVRVNIRLNQPSTAWVAARTTKSVGGGALDGYRMSLTRNSDGSYSVKASGISPTGQEVIYYNGPLPVSADNATPTWIPLLIVTYQNRVAFFANNRFVNAQENITILGGTVALGVESGTTADFNFFQLRDVSPDKH